MLDTRAPRNARQRPIVPAHFEGTRPWAGQLSPCDVARAYRIDHCLDYGPGREGNGLLITTGAGLLLSDMDQLPTMRYAIDLGASRGHPHAVDWATFAARLVTHTAAHLWMAITDPDWMRDVLNVFPLGRLAVAASPAIALGHQAANIDELDTWADQFREPPW